MRKLDREIAVLGSTSVGKSALTMRFVRDEFPTDYDPTIFKRYALQTTVNGIEYRLTLYDTAGLEQQSQLANSFLRSNGFVLVYSIADAQSFAIVRDIYERIAEELMQENIPIVLVGNKSDLVEKRTVTYQQGQELAKSINASFYETSARTGNNVKESFHQLLGIIDHHNPGSTSNAPRTNTTIGSSSVSNRNNPNVIIDSRTAGAQRASTSSPATTPKTTQDNDKRCIIS